MSLLQLAGVIGLRRIISGWRLETVLFLGILLAVALISSGVVYSDLLAEAALQRSLDRASPEDANIAVRAFNGLEGASSISRGASAHQEGRDFVDLRVWERFQPYFQDRAFLFESSTFFFQGHPQLELNDTERPRGKITYLSSLSTDRIEVVDGRWPYSAGTQPGDGADGLEVAIDDMGSRLLDLGVGDLMEVFPPGRRRECSGDAGENSGALPKVRAGGRVLVPLRQNLQHREGIVVDGPLVYHRSCDTRAGGGAISWPVHRGHMALLPGPARGTRGGRGQPSADH